jgi:hypothetical protein
MTENFKLKVFLREQGATKRYFMERAQTNGKPGKVIVMGNVPAEDHQWAAS